MEDRDEREREEIGLSHDVPFQLSAGRGLVGEVGTKGEGENEPYEISAPFMSFSAPASERRRRRRREQKTDRD